MTNGYIYRLCFNKDLLSAVYINEYKSMFWTKIHHVT